MFKHIYPKALCFCNFAESPPPGLSKRGITSVMPFYADVKVILPLIVATIALVAAAVIVAFRWRNSEFSLTNMQLFYKIIFVVNFNFISKYILSTMYLNIFYQQCNNCILNINTNIFLIYEKKIMLRAINKGCVCQDIWGVQYNGR